MRRALSLGILAVLATMPQVQAEDFTGAYAGVNVGYGFERGHDAKAPARGQVPNATTPDSVDLPPSAAIAARSLRQERSAAPR